MTHDNHKFEQEDPQVEAALRQFRQSVHAWSEQEFSRPRAVAPRPATWLARWHKPLVVALGCVVVVAGLSVPVGVHHQHAVAAQQQAQILEQQRKADEAARQLALSKVDDDQLLADVDEDIAQATPAALEPMASLMRETKTK